LQPWIDAERHVPPWGFQRGPQAPWPWVQHLAAEATAACGGNRELEQGQRPKFSSAAPRRDQNFGNRNPLIAGGFLVTFLAAKKSLPEGESFGIMLIKARAESLLALCNGYFAGFAA
jgi:hypothetical protein